MVYAYGTIAINLYLWFKNKLQMASIFYSNLNEAYYEHVYPYMVPIMLPIAQIAMTASVYMTVVTCFDRYCYSKLVIFIISWHWINHRNQSIHKLYPLLNIIDTLQFVARHCYQHFVVATKITLHGVWS